MADQARPTSRPAAIRRVLGLLLRTVLAAAAARAARTALATRPPGGAHRWERTNHRGETVSLLEGPAWVAGGLAGLAVPGPAGRQRAGAALAVAAAGVFGALDDLGEAGDSKGLRGHLGALATGRLTTGAVKLLGIGAGGLVAAAVAGGDRSAAGDRPTSGALRGIGRTLVGGALVAGTANLANLFDLRPGRALKVTLASAAAVGVSGPVGVLTASSVGTSVALLPDDLGERTMLGDTGANAAGAMLGAALVSRLGPRGQTVALAGVVALTLVSERVSFTKVIESTPVLRELDALGRRPR
jgi:hypothetical protein